MLKPHLCDKLSGQREREGGQDHWFGVCIPHELGCTLRGLLSINVYIDVRVVDLCCKDCVSNQKKLQTLMRIHGLGDTGESQTVDSNVLLVIIEIF